MCTSDRTSDVDLLCTLCVCVYFRESYLRATAIFSLYFLISEGDWYLDGFVYQTQRVMARAFNKLIF